MSDEILFTRPDFAWEHLTPVPNAIQRNPNLTPGEKGMIGYLLSHKSGYSLTMRQVLAENKGGKDAIASQIRGIEKAGYLRRTRQRDSKGRLAHYKWELTMDQWGKPTGTNSPSAENPPLDSTSEDDEKPQVGTSAGFSTMDKPATYKTTNQEKTNKEESFNRFALKDSYLPTSSTETTDRAREAPRQEKISSTEEQKQQDEADRQTAIDELTQQVRDFVMGLKYYGREYGTARGVTREQLHTLADLVTPFAEAGVDMRRLRSALVDRTEKGVHDIVALYMSRLKKIHTADVMPIRRPEIPTEPAESVAEVSQLPTPRSGDHDELPTRRKLLEETPVPPKPPWCGQCEKYTRQTPQGHRCPTCSLAAVITSTPLELVPDEHEPSPEEMRALFMAALAS